MEEAQLKQLFRRFIRDECTQTEVLLVIDSLRSEKCQQWFGELMDEMEQKQGIEPVQVSVEEVKRKFGELENRIQDLNEPEPEVPVRRIGWGRYWSVAASLTGLVLLAGLAAYFFLTPQPVVYQTPYGKVQTITLPDQSVVTLNGNSRLSFTDDWSRTGLRKVDIEGEAYFNVKKTPDRKPFLVQVGPDYQVNVLGTEFNVKYRPAGTRVVLHSGSIQLKVPVRVSKRAVLMKPGDLVELNGRNPGYTRKQVNTAIYTTWTQKRLLFDETTIEEIAQMLRETYNLKVVVTDPQLWKRKVSGTAPIQDIDIFLNALAGSFNLTISRAHNQVTISPAD